MSANICPWPGSPKRWRCRGTPPTTRCSPKDAGSSSPIWTASTSVAVIGVDEHVWRHTRRGDKYVTVIIDLTPVRDKTGPQGLLDMVEGRSKKAFQDWLSDRPKQWRDGVEVVAMDGFSGFKTATTEELPGAATVMDPFHVVRLAGNASTNAGVGSSWTPAGTAAARPIRSTPAGAPCRLVPICSPTNRRPG